MSDSLPDLNGDPEDFGYCNKTMIPYYLNHAVSRGNCHIFGDFPKSEVEMLENNCFVCLVTYPCH